MNIYLIPYMKYDESSTITFKYLLRYSFSMVDLKTSNWVYDSYEDVFSCLAS